MKKLFWDDPYLDSCEAKVTSIEGNRVKLDQTVFYAFSGGQASDFGTIGGVNVVEAVKAGDKESIIDITYVLEKDPEFKVGDEVEVKIDVERRNKIRNLHSAAHIVWYFVEEKLGKLNSIGSNVSVDKSRLDYLLETPISEHLLEIEEKVNKFIEEDHEVITNVDEEKPDLRWWVCDDWKMPCGGTHVRSTKEIGRIKLKRKNIGAGKERIEITLRTDKA